MCVMAVVSAVLVQTIGLNLYNFVRDTEHCIMLHVQPPDFGGRTFDLFTRYGSAANNQHIDTDSSWGANCVVS